MLSNKNSAVLTTGALWSGVQCGRKVVCTPGLCGAPIVLPDESSIVVVLNGSFARQVLSGLLNFLT